MSSAPARIGIDCRMFSSKYTGIGRYTYELVHHLVELDKENEYFLFFNEPEYEFFTPPSDRVKKILVNAPHYSIAEQIKFLKFIKKEKLDLMHFTHFNAPILYSGPSVVTIHDLTLHFFPGKKMSSPLYRLGYYLTIKSIVNKSKKIITVSNHTKKNLEDVLHIKPSKIEVIYEGINPKFHSVKGTELAVRTLQNFEITKPYLIYTGVWRDHKNIKGLIRAFHQILIEHSNDLSLVITGKADPAYAPEIYKLCADLGIKKKVIFPGLVNEDELIALISEAAVYVFPSFHEGFGLPPLEAMQCETPVAASNQSSIPEIVGSDNVLFFDPYDVGDMASKINQVLTNGHMRTRLIQNGIKHVKNFSWEKMAKKTLQVYDEILKGEKR
jgi:glycosyltransferase involved in cell wall biosynthesis